MYTLYILISIFCIRSYSVLLLLLFFTTFQIRHRRIILHFIDYGENSNPKKFLPFQGQSKNMHQGSVVDFSQFQLRPKLQIPIFFYILLTYEVKLQLICGEISSYLYRALVCCLKPNNKLFCCNFFYYNCCISNRKHLGILQMVTTMMGFWWKTRDSEE